MITVHKYFVLLVGAASISSFAAGINYSDHPVVVRMQRLDNLLKERNQIAIETFIQDEIQLNSPLKHKELNFNEALVAMLALYARASNHFLPETMINFSKGIKEIVEAKPTITYFGFEDNGLADHMLNWQTFVKFSEDLTHWFSRRTAAKIEWISYFVVAAAENLPVLKESLSKGLMIEFNDMRNQGNYIYIVDFTLKCKLKTFEYGERFNFEKFLKEWEISNRNDVQDSRREKIIIMGPQLKRVLIKDSLDYALRILVRSEIHEETERAAGAIHTALFDLTGNELAEHVDEVAYAMEFHSVLPENEVISTLHSMLKIKIQNSGIESRVNERRKDFEHARKNIIENDAKTVSNIKADPSKYANPKDLDYFTIAYRLICKEKNKALVEAIQTLFYKVESKILEPEIFDKPNVLALYAKQHGGLYESDEESYRIKPDLIGLKSLTQNFASYEQKADKLMTSIVNKTTEESLDVRNQMRILLRLAIQMNRIIANSDVDSLEASIEKIALLYLNLWKYGADIFVTSRETAFIREWYHFTLSFPKQVSKVLNRKMIKSICQYVNKGNPNPEADALLYVFFAHISSFLASQKRFADASGLSKKTLEWEGKVGYADTASPFIQEEVQRQKQLFYIFQPIQTVTSFMRWFSGSEDSGKVVRHHLELITSLKYWFDVDSPIEKGLSVRDLAKRQLLDGILTATANDKNAEVNLNDKDGKLKTKVNQLVNAFRQQHGLSADLAVKAQKCENIYGKMTD